MNVTQSQSEALSEVFAQVSHTGEITRTERQCLLHALLDETLSIEEKQAIDRLLYAVRQGRIHLIKSELKW